MFLQLDIVEFYPSISHKLLYDALEFARQYTNISCGTHQISVHARKPFPFNRDGIWSEQDNPEFDVTMGSYDGPEVCDLVGL